MFFFIAGVQPKTVTLEDRPRMCPACGLYQARLVRVDHYVSAFFIPLFRVKTGTPFIRCERCGATADDKGRPSTGPIHGLTKRACPACGKPVENEFSYCPFCGAPL